MGLSWKMDKMYITKGKVLPTAQTRNTINPSSPNIRNNFKDNQQKTEQPKLYLDQVTSHEVQATAPTDDFQCLDGGQTSNFRGACEGERGGGLGR